MGRQILVILGLLASLYGVVLYFAGRHLLHTMFGSDTLQLMSINDIIFTSLAVVITLVGTVLVCAKVAMSLQIHKM